MKKLCLWLLLQLRQGIRLETKRRHVHQKMLGSFTFVTQKSWFCRKHGPSHEWTHSAADRWFC